MKSLALFAKKGAKEHGHGEIHSTLTEGEGGKSKQPPPIAHYLTLSLANEENPVKQAQS